MEKASEKRRHRSGLNEALTTGNALVTAKLITQEQLDICLRQQAAFMEAGRNLFLEQILVMNRFISKQQLAKVINRETGGGQTGLFQTILPISVCKRYQVYPLRIVEGVMELKAAKPLSSRQLQAIRSASEVLISDIRVIPTDLVDINETLSQVTSNEDTFEAMLAYMKGVTINGTMLSRAIKALLTEGVRLRASDIHLDKKPDPESWISHRVDGVIRQTHLVPAGLMRAIFTRIKTEAGMDASDDRRAQDGRITVETQGRMIDFRVATQPITGGETMTMRVLDPEKLLGLEALFPNQPEMTALFERIAQINGKNGGLIIFSGPTGSGKSTSLYALTQLFPRDRMNVMSVEEPVELLIPFARQIQLNQLLAEKSTSVERSMLRQDPDVLILGEIRDADTMRAALKFAESGHLVLASIHAENADQTFERFLSFADQESKNEAMYVMARTLRVVINQRLIQSLCSCAEPVIEDSELLKEASRHGIPLDSGILLSQAIGCPRCKGTGYFGRVAAHETMVLSSEESVRNNITKLLFESMQNAAQIKHQPGVTFKSRQTTLGRLIEVGSIDVKTAVNAINQELI